MAALKRILVYILLVPLYLYRWFISPLTGPSCRHTPTCSKYAIEALKRHGPLRGFCMAANRISRCRPGGTHGYDPVPLIYVKKYKALKSLRRAWPRDNRLKR
ncbi:MAG TPA: membrane protein insertion efficiency factor YidD [Bacteroidetes bacterium]|nr:membrane protein insertion efficiency factor YidD [Bacteroidota bacterium]